MQRTRTQEKTEGTDETVPYQLRLHLGFLFYGHVQVIFPMEVTIREAARAG